MLLAERREDGSGGTDGAGEASRGSMEGCEASGSEGEIVWSKVEFGYIGGWFSSQVSSSSGSASHSMSSPSCDGSYDESSESSSSLSSIGASTSSTSIGEGGMLWTIG